jgi:molecular chaperone HtpG
MKTGQISVQSENIFPIIKKFLYSDQEIFLRELVSNAVDATNKLKTLSSNGTFKGELGDLTIHISLDEKAKTLTISDRGLGMDEEEIVKYLNQLAFSSAQEFVEKYKDAEAIIGNFGLGFYSAFMVASEVEVVSKSYKEGSEAIRWKCEGSPEYSLEPAEREHFGTDVILHMTDDATEYLAQDRIEGLLKKYCRFLSIPIQFGMRSETHYEGEGDDRKEIKEEVANVINNTDPIWKKKPTKLNDEDYKNFYQELYPYSSPPLFWIHMNIDYPFKLTGILYFPKLTNNLELQKNKIQLYCNQVYVTDDVSAIVPDFLTLLHGVIDSPDIPLNVSRSYLQNDHNVKKITSHITKKVADKLKEIYKKDKKEYEEKWDEIATFVKYGLISEAKFDERVRPFTLLKNTTDEYFTIEDYKEKVKVAQTDKHDRVVMIYANDASAQSTFIKAAQDKGYDVLIFDQIIDNHFMQHLETKEEKVTFVRVDSDIVDNLVQTDESRESVMSQKDQDKVKTLFESVLENEKSNLQFQPLTPDAHPVIITKPEFMRRFKEMQRIQGMDQAGFPDSYNVVVNTNHPLVADKLVKMRSEEKKHDFVQYLFDLARLNQGMLSGKEMDAFVKRSLSFVE